MPSGGRLVHVGARGKQEPSHVDVALLRGKLQRGETVRRAGGGAAAGFEQDFRHLRVVFRHGPHQRRLTPRGLRRGRVGSGAEQPADDLDVADARRGHQRRHPAGPRNVRVGAGLEQQIDHRDAGVETGEGQGRHPVVVGRVDVGAGADEQFRDVRKVTVSGPVQRRRAVPLRLVDVDTLGHEPLDASGIRRLDRVDQGKVDGARHGRHSEWSDREKRNDDRQDPHGWTSPSA